MIIIVHSSNKSRSMPWEKISAPELHLDYFNEYSLFNNSSPRKTKMWTKEKTFVLGRIEYTGELVKAMMKL